eukprot:248017_1
MYNYIMEIKTIFYRNIIYCKLLIEIIMKLRYQSYHLTSIAIDDLEPIVVLLQEVSNIYQHNRPLPELIDYQCTINNCCSRIDIDIDEVDKEDGHYSQWIILHPKPSSPITESILIGSYYRSPNRHITTPDI